jgi:hypothetical protein
MIISNPVALMSYVIRFFFRINHYSIDIKKHLMAINLILSNKNIEQFVDISSCEIFVPDDIIHPVISVCTDILTVPKSYHYY